MTMDADHIILGHGPLSSKKDITDMKKYLIAFDKMARELTGKTKDVQYIKSEIVKALPLRTRFEFLIPIKIELKYFGKK